MASEPGIRPLRIGIYTNVLEHRPTGIGWHVIHLINALSQIDPENQYFLIHRTRFWDRQIGHQFLPDSSNFRLVPISVPAIFFERYFRVYDRWILPRVLSRLRLDVFHGPNHYLPQRRAIPQVVTYHDVAEAVIGNTASVERTCQTVRQCLSRADGVIALSQRTLSDLASIAQLPQSQYIIYQGGNYEAHSDNFVEDREKICRDYRLPGRYLLFVGSVVERKDISTLVQAFALLTPFVEPDLRLVIAGGNDTTEGDRIRQACANHRVSDRVVFTGYLSNEQLAGLYRGASVFVLSSRYEGFGMILLEAMAAGLPIVCTAAGALPEILADAGVLVPPGDAAAFATAVRQVLGSPALAADLVARGRRRLTAFSWRTTAEQTLAAYRAVAARVSGTGR